MSLPKPKRLNADKYVAGLSLFKQKAAKIKLSLMINLTLCLVVIFIILLEKLRSFFWLKFFNLN